MPIEELKSQYNNIKINETCTAHDIQLMEGMLQHHTVTVNFDGTIDVSGDVIIQSASIRVIPFYFRTVHGSFVCLSNPILRSLEGVPRVVRGNCVLFNLPITSVNGLPKIISGHFVFGMFPDVVSLCGVGTIVHKRCACINNEIPFNERYVRKHINIAGQYYVQNGPQVDGPDVNYNIHNQNFLIDGMAIDD